MPQAISRPAKNRRGVRVRAAASTAHLPPCGCLSAPGNSPERCYENLIEQAGELVAVCLRPGTVLFAAPNCWNSPTLPCMQRGQGSFDLRRVFKTRSAAVLGRSDARRKAGCTGFSDPLASGVAAPGTGALRKHFEPEFRSWPG
jgi:hypothetical protein